MVGWNAGHKQADNISAYLSASWHAALASFAAQMATRIVVQECSASRSALTAPVSPWLQLVSSPEASTYAQQHRWYAQADSILRKI